MIDCDHMLNPNLIKGRSMGSSHIFPSSRIFFFKKLHVWTISEQDIHHHQDKFVLRIYHRWDLSLMWHGSYRYSHFVTMLQEGPML